ncbi:MAG: DUF4105 domain-containing protein [Wenzhouxiangella sp.]|nr:MAG: DUF4105 domain-containing protein [Wenzhouxiangella sp.]
MAGTAQRNWLRLVTLLLVLSATGEARSQEAWLVTYGPGEEVWELFGHNALWLRDPERGLDHTFSFGYFEIDRPGFHVDFARGIMLYYGAASPVEREFAFYRARDRSISVQRLALSPDQIRHLHRLIDEAIHPHPQYYAYDYFRANCSTWLRDLIDTVVDGQVYRALADQPARFNFRDHTRRMTVDRPWIHTGIMLLMGPGIDNSISAWEETFLPEALARWLDTVELNGQALVTERRMLHDPQRFQPPEQPRGPWLLLLAVGLLAALVIVVAAWRGGTWGLLPWRLAVALAGAAGMIVLGMWIFTGHRDTWQNLSLLLLHPLWWLLLVPWSGRVGRTLVAGLAAALAVGSLILAWPGLLQDRADLLALLLPPLLAVLVVAVRHR